MNKIIYKDLSANGPVSEIKDLANSLFKMQSERANKYNRILAGMNYETRGVRQGFENAGLRYMLVAYDGETPIGYVYCDAFEVVDFLKTFRPQWPHFEELIPQDTLGLYPPQLECPVMCSHLNNLYIRPEYRGQGIGKHLMDSAMEWLKNVQSAQYIFVHMSNGNNAGPFYEKYGFEYSHDVFDGLILCYMQKL